MKRLLLCCGDKVQLHGQGEELRSWLLWTLLKPASAEPW